MPRISRRRNSDMFLKLYIFVTVCSTLLVVYKNSTTVKHEADNTDPPTEDMYDLQIPDANTTDAGILFVDKEEEKERYFDQFYKRPRRRLPQCIIIGAAKCGTEALQFFLQLHPDIATDIQEINFFSMNILYNRGYSWLRHHMPPSFPHQITIQRGTWYWDTLGVPERLQAMNSSLKLILLACEPSRRVVSWYTHKVIHARGANPKDTFESNFFRDNQIVSHNRAVRSGRYTAHLARWNAYFQKNQMLIVYGESLRKWPYPELQKVEDFLNLEHKIQQADLSYSERKGFWCKRNLNINEKNTTPFDCLPGSKGRKHVTVNPVSLQKIKDYYKQPNEMFFREIGRRFDWNYTQNANISNAVS